MQELQKAALRVGHCGGPRFASGRPVEVELYEFFKITWNIIGSSFTKVLQAQLDRSRLTESGRHGATRLIPKVEGVPDVTQLRPITLLQTDYRLLSKCLAVRLHSVMKEVVHPSQLGTGDRNILTGVYNILSSIDIVNKKHTLLLGTP